MERINRNTIRRILCDEKNGVIKKKKEEFEAYDIELEIEENVMEELLNKVEKENLGARSVKNILNEIIGDKLYDCIENGYDRMTIHLGMLMNGEEPVYHSSQRTNSWDKAYM